MKKKKKEFENLTPDQQAQYLLNEFPNIQNFLKIPLNKLGSQNFDKLFDFVESSKVDKKVINAMYGNLANFAQHGFSLFEQNLTEELGGVREEALAVFKKTLLDTVQMESDNLRIAEKSQDLLFIKENVLSATVVVLRGILEFRKQIDAVNPELSEKIIDAASSSITLLITTQSPVIGMLIISSGVMNGVKNFLDCDNLEKTIGYLEDSIGETKKDKQLYNIYKRADQIYELSELTNVKTSNIQKLGLSLTDIEKTVSSVKITPEAKYFVQEVDKAAELIPSSNKEIKEKLNIIKELLRESLKGENVPIDVQVTFSKKLDTKFEVVEKFLNKNLHHNKSFFEKVAHQKEATEQMLEIINEFSPQFHRIKGTDVSGKLRAVVKDNFQIKESKLLKEAKSAPILASKLGLDNRTKRSLEKTYDRELNR